MVVLIVFILISCVLMYFLNDIQNAYCFQPKLINLETSKLKCSESTHNRYKAYTFFTKNYKLIYEEMMSTIKDKGIEYNAIVLPQEDLDACFAKHNKHFYDYRWRGCGIKIKLICDCIKANMGTYILFTDCDLLYIKPISGILDYYKDCDYDLVLTESCIHKFFNKFCLSIGSNVGFMFIKCSTDTLHFFEDTFFQVDHHNLWDEGVVKKKLQSHKLK